MMTGPELLQALPIAVYTTDAEGRITFFNDAAAALWGQRPAIGSDKWCGSWRLFHPDGTPLAHHDCPMAVALRDGRPVRGVEIIAERPDGTRARLLPCPTPLRDAGGRLTGAINILIDISDQHAQQLEAVRLAAIVASSDDAIISKTLEGRITSWNEGARRIFGYTAEEMIGQPVLRLIPPHLHAQEDEILAKLRRGEHIDHYETVRVTKHGRLVNISLTVSPLRDKFGVLIGASKVARDITERKEAEALQTLLMQELNHRVKNMLATVQAIAGQSLRLARSPAEFSQSFMGRVQALARVHSVLTDTSLGGADVGKIVREQVLLSCDQDERITCSGPLLSLDPKVATHLALILHELGTNARKYGALSTPAGQLRVTWSLTTENGRVFHLHWAESGGPRVSAPTRRGFGTTLIEQSLSGHGGKAALHYAAHGLTCTITLPLADEEPPLNVRVPARLADTTPYAVEMPAPPSALEGKRILLIEDEALVGMDMRAILGEAGCRVTGPVATIASGKAALAQERFDAALLDANLAGHPVDELAALLTQEGIPFAFVTGYGRDGVPQAFRDSPRLAKPFGAEQLCALAAMLTQTHPGTVKLRRKAGDS